MGTAARQACWLTCIAKRTNFLPPAAQFTLLDRGLWPMVRFFPYTMFTVSPRLPKKLSC